MHKVVSILLIACALFIDNTSHAAESPGNDSTESSRNRGFSLKLPYKKHIVAPGVSFVPRHGLVVTSSDDAFQISTRVRAQLRYELLNDGTNLQQAIMIRRARLGLAGHFFGKQNHFKIELLLAPRDLKLDGNGIPHHAVAHDVYVELGWLRDAHLRFGQYKVPFNRAQLISGFDTQLVDRAITSSEFSFGRDIGMQVSSSDLFGLGILKYAASITSGEGHSSFAATNLGFLYTARLEYTPFGKFADHIPGDFGASGKTTGFRLSLGAAYAFLDGAPRSKGLTGSALPDDAISRSHHATADAMLKVGGFSLQGDLHFRFGVLSDLASDSTLLPRNGFGGTLQGGYRLPLDFIDVELAAQGAFVRPYLRQTSVHPEYALGGGINLYLARHSMKIQADYFRKWDDAGLSNGNDTIRVQTSFAL